MRASAMNLLLVSPDRGVVEEIESSWKSGAAPDSALTCRWTPDPEGALEILGNEPVDVMVLDLALAEGLSPGLDLRGSFGDLPVVLLGPEQHEDLAERLVGLGAQDYLALDDLRPALLVRTLRYAVERRRALVHQREKEDRLRQVQKLEAVGQLAGGVAHDFNNMLSVILGFTELSQAEIEDDHPVQDHLTEVRRAAERARSLTRQLLAFSRRQLLKPEILDVNGLIVELRERLQRVAGCRVGLDVDLAQELGRVRVDPRQLEQVFLSIAAHARRAMRDGGRLMIETSDVTLDEHYAGRHIGGRAGQFVLIAFTETGALIDSARLPSIFEPFSGPRGQGEGSGLGLATVYGIVKQSRGNIWAYSEEGMGTTFKVYLPRYGEVTPRADEATEAFDWPVDGETVMVVDDEGLVRRLLCHLLEEEGLQVLEAGGPEEAMALAHRHGDAISILLTDLVMPGMNGRQLADRLSVEQPDLRVLFTSGYTENAVGQQGLLDEGMLFLSKPLNREDLMEKVRQCLTAPPYRQADQQLYG